MEYRLERARLYRESADELRAKAAHPDLAGKRLASGLILMARHYESIAAELENSVPEYKGPASAFAARTPAGP